MATMSESQDARRPAAPVINDSKATCSYANFCRVTGSPEELIVDFGLNSQPMSGDAQNVEITQRVVLNFFTAKRLLHAMHMAVSRHEQVFGELETDIQKRVIKPAEARG
jgi:hypothetical protein